jgi:NAD(P)-dependent dehydrogenase (short-subunit alcohol dehydrogenase family)
MAAIWLNDLDHLSERSQMICSTQPEPHQNVLQETAGENSFTLITGASSGIGRDLAVRLSSRRRLLLHGRDTQKLGVTLARCAHSDRHITWACDLQDIAAVAQSLGALMSENGITVECFVHSAGVLKVLPIRRVNNETFTEIMNVNVISAAEIISLLAKKTVNLQQLQCVLFISSIAANFGAKGFSMYCASKAALDGLMRALCVEMAPAVRVNSILPGAVSTPMTEGLLGEPDVVSQLTRDYPLGLGQTDDIVNAAEFLVSKQARWITGQQLIVDGGRTASISIS